MLMNSLLYVVAFVLVFASLSQNVVHAQNKNPKFSSTPYPTTKSPTTLNPTTTNSPTTLNPTTTNSPTTLRPTATNSPTTLRPTATNSPTTLNPTTTNSPTTLSPTTTNSPTTTSMPTFQPTNLLVDHMYSTFGNPVWIRNSTKDRLSSYNMDFAIHLGFLKGEQLNPGFVRVLDLVRKRLESILISDLSATYTYRKGSTCYANNFTTFAQDLWVDDLLIFVNPAPNVGIASAGPCVTAGSPSFSRVGILNIDIGIVQSVEEFPLASDDVVSILTHEIMHILGFGTTWNRFNLFYPSKQNPLWYNGTEGSNQFRTVNSGNTQNVELEQTFGGPNHFDECSYLDELMTPVLDSNAKLSAASCGVLKDMGLAVNISNCDIWTAPASPTSCDADGFRIYRRALRKGDELNNKIKYHLDQDALTDFVHDDKEANSIPKKKNTSSPQSLKLLRF